MSPDIDERELVGTYCKSHFFGRCTLELFADRRFTMLVDTDIGESGRGQGVWQREGDTLVLSSGRAEESETSQRFILVPWCGQMLLIDGYAMPGFCAEARGKRLARGTVPSTPHYRKKTDRALDLSSSMPEIAARFRDFYEKGPVRASVVKAAEDGTVLLRSRAIRRLWPGLRMTRWQPEGWARKR